MPFVHEIRTWFDATVSPSPENRRSWFQILNLDDPDAEPFEPERFALHELFSAYPNIESLSVSIDRFHGGCDGDPPSIRISSLAPGTTFPPLRSLSLSGYDVTKDEKGQRIWSKKFPWNQLQSLTLGHQDNPGFFKAATGKVRHLKKFEATHYGKPNSRRDLDAFLSSFHTLESLTAKGTIPSLAAMAHHSNLEHLCLHTIEQPDKERVSLNASEIRALNRKHPRLKSLELDIDPKGKWPDNIVKAIATGFKNLHQLSIHVGLRLPLLIKTCEADKTDDLLGFNDNYFKSVLTDETAQAFANRFFACRGPSAVKKITLQTGESLRWFPQWPPWYAESEGQHARTFEAYPPQHQGDEPCLKELMSDSEGVFPSSDSSEKKPQRLSRAPRVLRASGFPSVI
ncbi:hypothetical protein N7533_003013 [Penicillium manginii]|uniref:uncharacterized protein n=1 Tax=Penicillium manginii TaxID=203109 RepID=UPI0025488C13|nr:uncharacterized protein N7533_003013 [Penicillium manginii]KAJ5764332.1 hypothetical protein N7533_003013 [Penicillium manginii]